MPAILVGLVIVVVGYLVLEHRGTSSATPHSGSSGEASVAGGLAPSALTVTDGSNGSGTASIAAPPSALPTSVGNGPVIAAPSPGNPTAVPPPPSPVAAPAAAASWIFGSAQEALKAGLGNVYRDAKGVLMVTAPNFARVLKDPTSSTLYASAKDAAKGGFGSIYQEGGRYFVLQPNGPVALSKNFQPHVATADVSSYGSVSGVIRGWTLQADRLGNLENVPAHGVAGSTYGSEAAGPPPTQAEWTALTSAKGALPAGVHA